MESQIRKGNATKFLNLDEKKHAEEIENLFKSENPTKSDYFIRAFARIFNRDVILIDGNETVEMFHGGINNRPGKGIALILGVIREGQTGVNTYKSLLPNFENEKDTIVSTLSNLSNN